MKRGGVLTTMLELATRASLSRQLSRTLLNKAGWGAQGVPPG